jgi:hypothetical protein
MNKWLSEFYSSWQDKNFICAAVIFLLSYASIAAMALFLSTKVFVVLLSGIAGWQVASWSFRVAPKLKKILFKD